MDSLLNIREVADILAVTHRTVERLLRDDPAFPPPTRVGRSRRWRREWIENYIDGNRELPAVASVAPLGQRPVYRTNPNRKTG